MKPNSAWRVEYEIPPMRAIYTIDLGSCYEGEDAVRNAINEHMPQWKIRKITLVEDLPEEES